MAQYIDGLAQALGTLSDLHLFVPSHYEGSPGPFVLHRFQTGASHRAALRWMLNPWAGWQVWQRLLGVQPDVIHLINGDGLPWSVLWAAWAHRQGVAYGVTLHDPEAHPGSAFDAVQGCLGRLILPHVRWAHIHSARFGETIARRGVAPERIFVIPHGSLAPRFVQHARPGVARDDLALFFGRLVGYKGLDVLVEAGHLLDGSPRVALAGPGRLPRHLRQAIAASPATFELHDRYLTDPEVARLFQRAAVCVMPYRHATQSSVPLIAAAFGVPVVASAVGGLIEDVRRVNGLLVRPNDAAALAFAIRSALGRTPHYPRELEFDTLARAFLSNWANWARWSATAPDAAVSQMPSNRR